MGLHGFLLAHHDEVLGEAGRIIREKRPDSSHLDAARDENLLRCLAAVIAALRWHETGPLLPAAAPPVPRQHCAEQYDVDEVVYEYGSLCVATLRVADRHGHAISNPEHQWLNQALDDNIAADVVAWERRRRDQGRQRSAERLGCVVHELRNALQTASLSFQAIRSGRLSLQGVTGGIVERSHLRLRALVERLLAQVRVGSRALIRRERVALDALAQESVSFVEGEAKEKAVTIEVDVEPTCTAIADGTLLTSVFTNLLQNAVKFTPEGGTVTLRGRRAEGGRLRIEVEDRCGGVDPAVKELIFTPFVQGRDHRGLGLGLTIAREIVAAHDGALSFRDLPGSGCVFSIDLPAAEPLASGTPPPGASTG